MKGILLAGGHGTRLWPMTLTTSKQLLPIFDKPMVYYPLSLLISSGISEILLISTSRDIGNYQKLLGDGSRIGISISYAKQDNPDGLPQAFIIGEEHIGGNPVTLVLGDNVFIGNGMEKTLKEALSSTHSGITNLFGIKVPDPERFGVVEISENDKIISIEEKPEVPKSNIAVTGLYMYPPDVVQVAKKLVPSLRGELEISELNMHYVLRENARINVLEDECVWFDTGTPQSLHEASEYVSKLQQRTGEMSACIEEMAWKNGFMSDSDLIQAFGRYPIDSHYGSYLKGIIDND